MIRRTAGRFHETRSSVKKIFTLLNRIVERFTGWTFSELPALTSGSRLLNASNR
jgi:hypothetical protein